ncbi:hypothetical protein [Zymobacter sp. IVIA_12111.31 C1]|uniref:hypothetical protein n=1 Tax=Zymobacter sp. IVIA_12111.31 C1 TaxID=3394854 RepID=UPI0039C087EE
MKLVFKFLIVVILALLLTRFVIPHQPFLMFFADNLLYRDFMQKMSGDNAENLVEFLAISSELLASMFFSIVILKTFRRTFNFLKKTI